MSATQVHESPKRKKSDGVDFLQMEQYVTRQLLKFENRFNDQIKLERQMFLKQTHSFEQQIATLQKQLEHMNQMEHRVKTLEADVIHLTSFLSVMDEHLSSQYEQVNEKIDKSIKK